MTDLTRERIESWRKALKNDYVHSFGYYEALHKLLDSVDAIFDLALEALDAREKAATHVLVPIEPNEIQHKVVDDICRVWGSNEHDQMVMAVTIVRGYMGMCRAMIAAQESPHTS